jgi:hypothetical protein
MESAMVEEIFRRVGEINYNNREGGRYAYVQLMAYTRQLIEHLRAQDAPNYLIDELCASGELLNALVPLKFEEEHRIVFNQKVREFSQMSLVVKTLCEQRDRESLPLSASIEQDSVLCKAG